MPNLYLVADNYKLKGLLSAGDKSYPISGAALDTLIDKSKVVNSNCEITVYKVPTDLNIVIDRKVIQ